MRRPATWSTRLTRAALIALVPLTIVVQVALAHYPPISQTFRGGETLTSFSGTFEVIWPSDVYVAGAEIKLLDSVNNPLLQAFDGAAVELDVPCPEFGERYRCARIRLTDIPALAPGSYVMYWRVVHLDDYIEQRQVRFTIDPNWVSPSPTAVTPSPTASATPVTPSPAPVSPSPTLASSPTASESATTTPTTTPTATPSASTSAGPATPSPSTTPTTVPSPGPQPEENGAFGQVGLLALGLLVLIATTLIRRYRRQR
jgi:methionine-rich copper-binding protein CopC